MLRKSWHVYARGTFIDGSRVFIIETSGDYSSRLHIAAVLVCRDDGLVRLWRDGREKVLSAGFVWPSNEAGWKGWWDHEFTLRPFTPKHWGSQNSSGCIIKEIPERLLKSGTTHLARLLLAWWTSKEQQFSLVCGSLWSKSTTELPASKPWTPAVITVNSGL